MAFTIDRIFPTEFDLGGSGKGRILTETNHVNLFGHVPNRSFVISGFTGTINSPANYDLTISNGEAVIAGRRVVLSGSETFDIDSVITPPDVFRIWIYLTVDANGLATGIGTQIRNDEVIVSNGLCLGQGRVTSSKISHWYERNRTGAFFDAGVFRAEWSSGAQDRNIVLGWRPRMFWAQTTAGMMKKVEHSDGSVQDWYGGTSIGGATFTDYGISIANGSGMDKQSDGWYVAWR